MLIYDKIDLEAVSFLRFYTCFEANKRLDWERVEFCDETR